MVVRAMWCQSHGSRVLSSAETTKGRCDLDRATSTAMPIEVLAQPLTRERGPRLIVQHVDHPADRATPLRHGYLACGSPDHAVNRSTVVSGPFYGTAIPLLAAVPRRIPELGLADS